MRLFFILSGEHPTLPPAEVKAILEAEEVNYILVRERPHLIEIEAPISACERVCSRASMTLQCCIKLFECNANYEDIYRACRNVEWSFIGDKSYAVRVKRIRGASPEISTRILEREIGAIIYGKLGCRAKVNLVNPEILIQGILIDDQFLLGLSIKKIKRGVFELRRPKYRPFFHPSSLNAIISRLFVNLSRAKRGEVFLDPFCGAGSFLIEASLIGCQVIGLDVDQAMVEGARINLVHFNVSPIALIHGDAKHLPLKCVDSIATDPPYGRSASTRGLSVGELIERFLYEAGNILRRGRFMCIASPSTLDLEGMAKSAGFRVVELHSMRVHKSLTRLIAVLSK